LNLANANFFSRWPTWPSATQGYPLQTWVPLVVPNIPGFVKIRYCSTFQLANFFSDDYT
jgi:hypothetical protein